MRLSTPDKGASPVGAEKLNMFTYLTCLMSFGADYAYRQLACDISLNYRGLSVKGTDKAIAALIGFASRD